MGNEEINTIVVGDKGSSKMKLHTWIEQESGEECSFRSEKLV